MHHLCGRRWGLGLFLVIVIGVAWLGTVPASAYTLDDILQRVRWDTRGYPSHMGFRQEIKVTAFIKTWRFTSEVVRKGNTVTAETQGAPQFIPAEVTATLVDPEVLLADFDLALAGERMEGSDRYYIIEGSRKPGVTTGAISGRLWIDPSTWLIARIEARYWWGTLDVRQTYRAEQGLTVLDHQTAVVHPFGVRMEVTYTGYWFGPSG
ncbi:MAG TPA: hypothetical protein VF234_05415 [Limnochordia bacterium]